MGVNLESKTIHSLAENMILHHGWLCLVAIWKYICKSSWKSAVFCSVVELGGVVGYIHLFTNKHKKKYVCIEILKLCTLTGGLTAPQTPGAVVYYDSLLM